MNAKNDFKVNQNSIKIRLANKPLVTKVKHNFEEPK
jgi:hypothetical protein